MLLRGVGSEGKTERACFPGGAVPYDERTKPVEPELHCNLGFISGVRDLGEMV